MKTLTKDQVTNLVLNAYGFIDKHGVLFYADDSLIEDSTFQLQDPHSQVLLEFSYDNSTFENGLVTFEDIEGGVELFTVLIVALDRLNVSDELLGK